MHFKVLALFFGGQTGTCGQLGRTYNIIVLGGLLKVKPMVSLENVIKGLKKTLPERHHHLIPMNEEAIRRGMDLIQLM